MQEALEKVWLFVITASFSSVLLGYPADWALHLLTTSVTVFKIFLLGEALSFWHAAYLPSLLSISATVSVSEATWQTQPRGHNLSENRNLPG